MRYILPFVVLLLSNVIASCEEASIGKLIFDVSDVESNPLPSARINLSTFSHWEAGQGFGSDVYKKSVYSTDEKGKSTITINSPREDVTYQVSKSGYYSSKILKFKFESSNNGVWQPDKPIIQLSLRKVINPIPLMAKKVWDNWDYAYLPNKKDKCGYDLEVGDWVKPYGTGKKSDILFEIDRPVADEWLPYECRFIVSFSNPHDGMLLYENDRIQSELKLPYLAPIDGYKNKLTKIKKRVKGARAGANAGVDELYDDTKENENYYLRVRTSVNSKGDIISANYVKIYGAFEWSVQGAVRFQYYFNPNPNDRNLEFKVGGNLLKVELMNEVKDP